jgi:hypothetical protein
MEDYKTPRRECTSRHTNKQNSFKIYIIKSPLKDAWLYDDQVS